MPVIVKRYAAVAVMLALTGVSCSRGTNESDEMSWARAALERNTHLSVVAVDGKAKTFTVKLKDTGELRVLPLDQVVAGPAGSAADAAAAPATASAAAPPAPGGEAGSAATTSGTAGAGTAGVGSDAAAASAAAQPAAGETASTATAVGSDGTAQPGEPARAAAETPDATAPGASAAGASATGAGAAGPRAASAASAPAGKVLASGPGYTIQATGSRNAGSGAAAVRTARGIQVERLHDPIICQGSRLLHIDNRNLEFDGDAISAESGCEIHITNTHIRAKGIGVQARAANVYVENSDIEGDGGAIEAADGAQIYAESSRFKGLTRRMQASDLHDLGGNVWN